MALEAEPQVYRCILNTFFTWYNITTEWDANSSGVARVWAARGAP